MILLLMACKGPAPSEGDSQEDSPVVELDDTDTASGDSSLPEGTRDVLLVTEHRDSLNDDHNAIKQQAGSILAALGPADHLGVITDGADGCSQSGVLDSASDPSRLSNALNGQPGPLTGDLLEVIVRAYAQTVAGCNAGLGRPEAEQLVIIISNDEGKPNDLNGVDVFSPVIWWLGESNCSGPYADAASESGGLVLCPWQPDGLTTALASR